jgi:predicted 3-demethylubiquinone-9 3-methyltransferase (glyoxalase superfamily)
VDYYWDRLTDGGEESMCGWLVDRFGVSWQITPTDLAALIGGPDPEGAARASAAMLEMRKLDIAALRAAYEGG